jgi:hypothetical protein
MYSILGHTQVGFSVVYKVLQNVILGHTQVCIFVEFSVCKIGVLKKCIFHSKTENKLYVLHSVC